MEKDMKTNLYFLMPVNLCGNHWALIVFDKSNFTAFLMNSLESKNYTLHAHKIVESVGKWISNISKVEVAFNFCGLNVVQQNNGYDCGVYMIKFCLEFLKLHSDLKGNVYGALLGAVLETVMEDVTLLFPFEKSTVDELRLEILTNPVSEEIRKERENYRQKGNWKYLDERYGPTQLFDLTGERPRQLTNPRKHEPIK
jgi:Ulp1 family protease